VRCTCNRIFELASEVLSELQKSISNQRDALTSTVDTDVRAQHDVLGEAAPPVRLQHDGLDEVGGTESTQRRNRRRDELVAEQLVLRADGPVSIALQADVRTPATAARDRKSTSVSAGHVARV
jgi:hypothetical protein